MSDKPAWREAYDRLSAEVGPRLTELTASDGFAEAVEMVGAVGGRASDELERRSRRLLHAWNLPSGSDISVLRHELGALTREVRALARQVDALQAELAQLADPAEAGAATEATVDDPPDIGTKRRRKAS